MSFRTGMRMVRKLKRYGGRGRRRTPVAVKALKKVNRLKRQIGTPEMKYITGTNVTPQAVGFAGYTSTLITSVPQGSANDDRIGDKVLGKYIDFRYLYSNTVGAEGNMLRVVVVRDKLLKAASIPIIDLNNGTGTISAITQPLDYNIVRNQYQVIYDRVHNFNAQDNTSEFTNYKRVMIPINRKLVWETGTTTQSANQYRVYAWSNVSASAPALFFTATLYYTDV